MFVLCIRDFRALVGNSDVALLLLQMFLEQVAQFIATNTQGAQLGGASMAADPYTGSGAYTSGGGGVTGSPAANARK